MDFEDKIHIIKGLNVKGWFMIYNCLSKLLDLYLYIIVTILNNFIGYVLIS